MKSSASVFIHRNLPFLPELSRVQSALQDFTEGASIAKAICAAVQNTGCKIYVLIDEYDAFANDLLAHNDLDSYEKAAEETGFVRAFYRALKAGTRTGAIERAFVTGVLPMMLDDMASGFNIATNISLSPQFALLTGFTRGELELAVDQFLSETPLLPRDALLQQLERYYNGYRFAEESSETLFNPDLALYYLQQLRHYGKPPRQILDLDVRVDYNKLRFVATPKGHVQDWHENVVNTLLSEGRITGEVIDRFGLKTLYDRQYVISLLYFMGLITIEGPYEGGRPSEFPMS